MNSIQIRTHTIRRRAGFAMVPTLLLVSGLAVFIMALVTATLAGNRAITYQADDYKMSSAVETAAILSMESVWSDFLIYVNALPPNHPEYGRESINNFRDYMTSIGIDDRSSDFDADGDGSVDLIPSADDGVDVLPGASLPTKKGRVQVNNVNIDAVRMVRIDFNNDSTQLYLTVSASATRGEGLTNPIRNRAVQQVYTIEPAEFSGFKYALLSNNVNCVFCHTNVDSVDRWYNRDSSLAGSFERIRVGTLESLMIRHNDFGSDPTNSVINDFDADSVIAGTIYSRGQATLVDGSAIPDWDELSLKGLDFTYDPVEQEGFIDEPLDLSDLSPEAAPHGPGGNLYLDYADEYSDQNDGAMPDYFPPPIPDDGGVDPGTGMPDLAAIGNRLIDDAEFDKVAGQAQGAIVAGVVNVTAPGDSITTIAEYSAAVFNGNQNSIQQRISGNVVLTGTEADPITINGTIAIDGDLIIQGVVHGKGAIIVRGNVYIPTDLAYLDGTDSGGNRTFGVDASGQENLLGLASGGSIMIGDYQRPSKWVADSSSASGYSVAPVGTTDTITGDKSATPTSATGSFPNQYGRFSFGMTEMALFNRREWSKTQAMLPGVGGVMVANPGYDANYIPRYYNFGEGTTIPIQNKSFTPGTDSLYFDPNLELWLGSAADEGAIFWNDDQLTYLEPGDTSDPNLFDASGNPVAVVQSLSPKDDWIAPNIYQLAAEYFHANRGDLDDEPMNIDALIYTNNAVFSLVNRNTNFRGRMTLNGALVCADLGMLVPGNPGTTAGNQSSQSSYQIGLQLNYDSRVKKLLNVTNPGKVQLKRTLWNPTANLR